LLKEVETFNLSLVHQPPWSCFTITTTSFGLSCFEAAFVLTSRWFLTSMNPEFCISSNKTYFKLVVEN